MNRLWLVLFVLLSIYLAYRFWTMGYQLGEVTGWGGTLVASSTCLGMLAFVGGGLWWASRQGPRTPRS